MVNNSGNVCRDRDNNNNMRIRRAISRFLRDEGGATAIEYALIAALISVASIVAMQLVGTNINIVFMRVARELESVRRSVQF